MQFMRSSFGNCDEVSGKWNAVATISVECEDELGHWLQCNTRLEAGSVAHLNHNHD